MNEPTKSDGPVIRLVLCALFQTSVRGRLLTFGLWCVVVIPPLELSLGQARGLADLTADGGHDLSLPRSGGGGVTDRTAPRHTVTTVTYSTGHCSSAGSHAVTVCELP